MIPSTSLSECLQDDKVLGRTGQQRDLRQELERRCPGDHLLFEGQPSKRHVDPYSRWRLKQEDAVFKGKLGGTLDPWLKAAQQGINEGTLSSKTGQQCEVDILRNARLAPALEGQTTDEAEPPPVCRADPLDLAGDLE
jgi:hypothetical protein